MPLWCREEVLHILSDGGEAEIVLTRLTGHGGEEACPFLVLDQRPGLVDQEDARPAAGTDLAPDVAGDQVDAERPQLRLQVAHAEDDEGAVEVDARR